MSEVISRLELDWEDCRLCVKKQLTYPAKLAGQLRCAALNVVGVPGGRT